MIQQVDLIGISEKDETTFTKLIEFMKIISEPHRFKIIHLLYKNTEIDVTDMAILLNISQPAVSQHLKILKLGHILKQRKKGRVVYYSLDYKGVRNTYGEGIDYLRRYFLNENKSYGTKTGNA